MNVATVMDEIATALDTITGLRVYAYPHASPKPPAAVVDFPEEIAYQDADYDRMTIPVFVTIAKVSSRTDRNRVIKYANNSGALSVKVAVDGGTYTAADSVCVTNVQFDVFPIGGVEYWAARYEVDVVGAGN